MHIKEEELLEEICNKYGVDFKVLLDLFKIEKKHADRNAERRVGIYKELSGRIMESID